MQISALLRSTAIQSTAIVLSAFLAVLCTFNLLSLYQHQTTPDAPYRQPGTLRVAVFLCGAMLVSMATGPVDTVLLMAGKSGWNLANTAVALTLNVGLNLVLIELLRRRIITAVALNGFANINSEVHDITKINNVESRMAADLLDATEQLMLDSGYAAVS